MQSLTAEDMRLLLNGVGDINVTTLISYTTFNDESSEGSDKLLKFKRWFWSIVEKMNTLERQDLVRNYMHMPWCIVTSIKIFDRRYTFGPDLLHCLLQRKDFSLCLQSQYDRQMILIYQQPIRAYPDYIYPCILASQYCVANCSWL